MRIERDNVVYQMSKDNEPVAKIKSGDSLVFETQDCFSCEVKSENDEIDGIDFSKVNPATGPVYVEGAEVGDALKVTIEKIELADKGITQVEPDLGRLGDQITEVALGDVHVKGEELEFRGYTFPQTKMVGVIGTAPAGDSIPTGLPGDHGGNLDCTSVAEGNAIYLPVNVEGALLAMGDAHAAMGDGELGGCAAEINADITVTVEVIKDFDYELPMVETPDTWMSLATAETTDGAIDKASANMADFIMKNTEFDIHETAMYMTMVTSLRACQVVNPTMTFAIEIPKARLEK